MRQSLRPDAELAPFIRRLFKRNATAACTKQKIPQKAIRAYLR